jgi:hypothetical protein
MEPHPFAYPVAAHVRKHGPRGYKEYESCREWLRDEFDFRCVFCLFREQWPNAQSFEIDHLLPRSQYPEMECNYDNLLYLCPRCNGNKRAKLVPDPCRVAIGKCVQVQANGRIAALNREGRLLVKALRLDNDAYTRMRELMIGILETCFRHNRPRFVSLMGYPTSLPDLASLNPPGGNTKPEGVKTSAFARREREKLPEVY